MNLDFLNKKDVRSLLQVAQLHSHGTVCACGHSMFSARFNPTLKKTDRYESRSVATFPEMESDFYTESLPRLNLLQSLSRYSNFTSESCVSVATKSTGGMFTYVINNPSVSEEIKPLSVNVQLTHTNFFSIRICLSLRAL